MEKIMLPAQYRYTVNIFGGGADHGAYLIS
jgi:hypothetical protein